MNSEPLGIEPLPALADNYFWLLARGARAAIVDPGDAWPVLHALAARALHLEVILVTHHHADHIGGVAELHRGTGARVFGPEHESIGHCDRPLAGGERIEVLDTAFEVLAVPGHTLGHLAYFAPEPGALFCGDTLFAGGCGRLFEGTPAQMLASLDRLAALPAATQVHCAHEYTLANLRFALAVEPDNAQLQARFEHCTRQRQRGEPTLPSTIGVERSTNPFLRVREPAPRAAAERHEAGSGASAVATFAALRRWKDSFTAR